MAFAKSGAIIRQRCEAIGCCSPASRISGRSWQALVGLEADALSDLGFNRMAQVLWVLGLDLDLPSQAARSRYPLKLIEVVDVLRESLGAHVGGDVQVVPAVRTARFSSALRMVP